MHELLASAAAETPVSGNAHGSYLTIRSKNGLIFGVINVIGNFATVFQDQAVSAVEILRTTRAKLQHLVLATRNRQPSRVLRQSIPPRRPRMVRALYISIHVRNQPPPRLDRKSVV